MKTLLEADDAVDRRHKIVNHGVVVNKCQFEAKRAAPKSENQERKTSRERPSSKWRQGITQDNLDKAEEESLNMAIELQNKNVAYPDWWAGKEDIEREQRAQNERAKNFKPSQAKAKVNKNLQRYAEDSLDARLREVRQQTEPQMEIENCNTSNMMSSIQEDDGKYRSQIINMYNAQGVVKQPSTI